MKKQKIIHIYKNYFKGYHKMKWIDVPEFLLFKTMPEGWIQIKDVDDETLVATHP